MANYKITIEYDGSNLAGWQRQSNAPSVQEYLENAIESLSGEKVSCYGAGRTDAGVHARGQVAHFKIDKEYSPQTICNALNFHLMPKPVCVTDCELVDDNFHARFSAIKRHYKYVIINRSAPLILEKNRAWHVKAPLQLEMMQEAAKLFIGTHDFTTFRSSACQSPSPIKTLDRVDIERQGEYIFFYLSARSFLHNMVRNIVGTLKMVGAEKWVAENISSAFAAKDRSAGGPTAPAQGLYFMKVDY